MDLDMFLPRYQVVYTSIDSGERGLQLNQSNRVHLNFPQRAMSAVGLSVGIPKWNAKADGVISLRVGWNDTDHQDLTNGNNTQEDYLWLPLAMAAIPGSPYRLSIETSAANGAWPANTGSFRVKSLSVDTVPISLEEWSPWIEEDTTCPGPGNHTGAPPTCIAFPGNGDRCNVCAAGPDGIVGLCPLVRRATGFPYKQYAWHGRFFWCRESPY